MSPRGHRLTWKVIRETSRDLNFITDFLTFYLLSRSFVVKTAKRARLTFWKFIYHWHPEVSFCKRARLTFWQFIYHWHPERPPRGHRLTWKVDHPRDIRYHWVAHFLYFKPSICCKNSEKGTTYFWHYKVLYYTILYYKSINWFKVTIPHAES